jgi:hypothetical protein
MPINPNPAANWAKAVKVVSVSALATMALGAIMLPVLGIVAGMAFTG